MLTPEEARDEELCLIGAQIFHELPDPHLIFDEHFIIKHVNRAAADLLGYSMAELSDKPVRVLLVADMQDTAHLLMADPKLVVQVLTKHSDKLSVEVKLRAIARSIGCRIICRFVSTAT